MIQNHRFARKERTSLVTIFYAKFRYWGFSGLAMLRNPVWVHRITINSQALQRVKF